MSRRLQRRADETAKLVASHAPITLEVTKEAVRRIRRTLSRDEGEDLILKRLYERGFPRGHGRFPQQADAELQGQVAGLTACQLRRKRVGAVYAYG